MKPRRPETGGRGRNRRGGSVLLFVLILVVITSAALLRFNERALQEMAGEGYYVQRNRLRAEAFSALEATLAVLAEYREIDGGLFAPAQGWADPLAISGYTPAEGREVTVEFADENAKLSLKRTDAQQEMALQGLFGSLGFTADEVDVLTDSLLDWIDQDDNPRPSGAEKDEYLRDNPPHLAANAPPRTFEELAVVQGFGDLMFTETGTPTARMAAFHDRVSLYSNGTINLNTAPEEVLRATGLFDENQLKSLAGALDTVDGNRGTVGARYYASLSELKGQVANLPSGSSLGVRCLMLGIIVTVHEGQAVYRLRAVVRTDASGVTGGSAGASNTTVQNNNVRTATGSSASKNSMGRGAGSTVGASDQIAYPFRFLELVEDPPPTTIADPSSTP